jgi:hypothetical protein
MQGLSWLSEEPLTSLEGLCCMELIGWLVGWFGWLDGSLICWFIGRSVGKSVNQWPVVLLLCFTFRMQELKLKSLQ